MSPTVTFVAGVAEAAFAVERGSQGQGIGTALLEAVVLAALVAPVMPDATRPIALAVGLAREAHHGPRRGLPRPAHALDVRDVDADAIDLGGFDDHRTPALRVARHRAVQLLAGALALGAEVLALEDVPLAQNGLDDLFEVLAQVYEAMKRGLAIHVAPLNAQLTTQEAANFLGISRPTLVKLLEGGELAHELTSGGRHRRVRLQDVVQYQEAKRRDRRAALEDLTGSASEAGLYDEDADRYRQALRQARRDLGRQAR